MSRELGVAQSSVIFNALLFYLAVDWERERERERKKSIYVAFEFPFFPFLSLFSSLYLLVVFPFVIVILSGFESFH